MSKYRVQFEVYRFIEEIVEADDENSAMAKGQNLAAKKLQKVYWVVNLDQEERVEKVRDDRNIEVYEIDFMDIGENDYR